MKSFDRLIATSLPVVPRPLVRHFADRYIAGETLDDAVATVPRPERDRRARPRSTCWASSSATSRGRGDGDEYDARCWTRSPRAASTPTCRSSSRRSASRSTRDLASSARPPACSHGGRRPRHLRAHRHGAQRPHRPDDRRLPHASARQRARRRRHRHPGLHAPHRRRLRRAGRPDAERAPGQGHLRRAAGHRLSRACPRSTRTSCGCSSSSSTRAATSAVATHDGALVAGSAGG